MSDAQFPPNIAAALDRLTVPPVPTGFADRLAARIESGDFPPEANMPLPAKPRLTFARRPGWRRIGSIGASVVALGLATATAAASGAFGEPVYVPVVSDVLAKADLVELPRQTKSKPSNTEKAKPLSSAKPAAALQQKANGRETVRTLIQSKWQDPQFRRLPKEERQAAMREALRKGLADGDFTGEDIRAAMADARAKREQRLQRGDTSLNPERPKLKGIEQKLREKVEAERQHYEQASPAEKAELRIQHRQAMQMRQRLRQLREQLRRASPDEKPAIRAEMQDILQKLGQKFVREGEGNPGDVR